MEQFIIQGRKKLKGEIEVRGSKNAAFPVLAATLLTTEDCLIRNLPLIEDVLLMLELFKSMGAEVSWQGERVVKINTKAVDPNKINKSLISK
ncbi:MAG: UDP-N-acetylglucosamine 1-carboxyvinyltransferase, partial [Candidatus Pacebacteria bacterium]|nr:UDP-N-acetylglucosamine 1-carboxyvinyltransferase [Candidatus Paceibacterota bacterium]